MNKSILSILSILFLLAAGLTLRGAEADALAPVTVAVLPFDASDEKLQAAGGEVAALLSAQLTTQEHLWVVERAEMDKLLAEQTMKLTGLVDPASAAQVGRILGARVLVTGRLIKSGEKLVLVGKVMSTETSRVFGETTTAPGLDALEKPVQDLAEKVGQLINKQRSALVPPTVTRDQRMARMKEQLQGKSLASVQINIKEQALHQKTVDPAVATEIGKVLMELGGEVVDAKHNTTEAALLISGEAFSETGARRGQLVCSRARVELQVLRRSDNKVLAVDRESGVAVDIAEASAGKAALHEAALNLVERLLPKLVKP